MKSLLRSGILLLAIMGIMSSAVLAQLSGTLIIPNATYPTLATFITALNTQGVGTGGLVINMIPGSPQTAPPGGYRLGSTTLNASLSIAKPLTINGNNNVITAQVGTGGADGAFFLSGTDYVTIDNLGIQQAAANNTATTAMEYGYALMNLNSSAPFDGCQHNAIRNCSIQLNRSVANFSIAIYTAHATAASSSALTITASGDLHNDNKFYSNNISNVVTGIFLNGYNAPAPYLLYDKNNDIGGLSMATGNTITNFLGNNLTNIGGISILYQDSTNVSYNVLNDTANGGVKPVGAIWGINAFASNSSFTMNNNTVVLSAAFVNSTYYTQGIIG